MFDHRKRFTAPTSGSVSHSHLMTSPVLPNIFSNFSRTDLVCFSSPAGPETLSLALTEIIASSISGFGDGAMLLVSVPKLFRSPSQKRPRSALLQFLESAQG